MKKSELNNYVIARLNSIEKELSIYQKDKKPESLHRLRVDIKKIKAILSFAENIYNDSYYSAELRPLFKKAGEIREIQIFSNLLALFPEPPEQLIEELRNKETILTEQFVKNVLGYKRILKKFHNNVSLPEELPTLKAIDNYFSKEKKKAKKKLKRKDREDLHRYRAKIKKLMYIYNTLPKKTQVKLGLKEDEIDRLQQKLGYWHDNYAAINFLFQKELPVNTSGYITKIKEKEKKEFNALYNRLAKNRTW